MATFAVKYDWVKSNNTFPKEALRPKTYGFDEIVFEPGDYSQYVFNPLEGARFVGTQAVKMGGGTIGAADSVFDRFHWAGYLQIRPIFVNQVYQPCHNIRFTNGIHTGPNAQPIRVRFGATDIIIEDSYITRCGVFPTGDVAAIYTSDHTPSAPCKITIRRNLFVDYTDGIQFGNRQPTDFGLNAGSVIEDNLFVISPSRRNTDGTMKPGLENALDFKTGGTATDPVIVRRNRCVGYRPAILAGAGTPGYAVTTHQCASNITFQANEYIDCESVYFMTNRTDMGFVFEDEVWVDIKNHGAKTPWTLRQGSIIAGTGIGTWRRCRWLNCDRLEEMPNATRVFDNCQGL